MWLEPEIFSDSTWTKEEGTGLCIISGDPTLEPLVLPSRTNKSENSP